MFSLNPELPKPLVQQIVDGFQRLITDQTLRPGTKVPSIRQFAHSHGVSVFTVVEAYDRLVAQGWLVSRASAGFFAKHRPTEGAMTQALPPRDFRFDARWYLRSIFENRGLRLKAGCGWLPHDWLFEDGVRRSLRQLATVGGGDLGGYGLPQGHMPLRQLIAEALSEQQLTVGADNILLTQGSSQALDLVARRLSFCSAPRSSTIH